MVKSRLRKNYDITFDNDAMVEYTRGLSKKYSTFGDRVEFMVG